MPNVKKPGGASSSRRRFLANVGLMTTWTAVAPTHVLGMSTQPDSGAKRLQAFDLTDVDLAEGPFLHAQRMTEAYLLALEPDRMLHNFRVNAGLKPKASVYGGWESDSTWEDLNCHGHTLGHYLSACALAYSSTNDKRFKQRVEYIASELAACQRAAGIGLVCAFPKGPALV